MNSSVVVGLQWGDEGKGKVSYLLSRGADAVVRFQGGANAGHTVVLDGRRLKFNILPAGSASGARPVIGAGCIVDVERLEGELSMLQSIGVQARPLISRFAGVVLSLHKDLDGSLEALRGKAIGTTRMGIGPAYADKCLRIGLRVGDLSRKAVLAEKLRLIGKFHNLPTGEDFERLSEAGGRLAQFVGDTTSYLVGLLKGGGRVVFEGAQGALLDLDYGTYPYVTSSHTLAGAASIGSGVPHTMLGDVVGVMKAYTTRVGGGPFPTEIDGGLAEIIRSSGAEYGTTTGRPRRVGWLDIPALRYACMLNGVSWLAVTKLDVLSNIDEVKVCVRYLCDGVEYESLAGLEDLSGARPVYEVFKGWRADASEWSEAVKGGWDMLPSNAREYLGFVEKMLGVGIGLVSVGEPVGYEVFKEDRYA
ncbi:Adenylosuccinate synthetase [archaeon HR01]|nr:Adenylosuccinate synthetase [archaeon HR01]